MAKDDLTLASGLIKKGEARGLSPALAIGQTAQEPAPQPASASPPALAAPEPPQVAAAAHEPSQSAQTPAAAPAAMEDDPPLRALPPDDVAKRFTSFRLPVALDEDLRAMMFETRRSKQDLLIDFVTTGVQAWRRDRVRR